jgi:mRNA interferase HicA
MTGHEFLKRLAAYAKAHDMETSFVAKRGKGSHGTVYLGGLHTTVKDRKKEIGVGLLRAMLADLGIDPKDF